MGAPRPRADVSAGDVARVPPEALAADATKSDTITLTIDPPGALRWTRQFGTSRTDTARGIATDASGHVYVTGETSGALEGSNAGGRDAIILAYGR